MKAITGVAALAPFCAGVSPTQPEARGKCHHLVSQEEYVAMGLNDNPYLLG